MNSKNKRKVKRRTLKRLHGGNNESTDKCIFVKFRGGLGNQLFIYAAALIVKNKFNMPLYFIPDDDKNPHSDVNYMTELFKQGKEYTKNDIKEKLNNSKKIFCHINSMHTKFSTNNINYNSNKNLYLNNELYQNYESIHTVIPSIRNELKNVFEKKYPDLRNSFDHNKTAFMHVRLGDFVGYGMAKPMDYYQKGLDLIKNDKNIKYMYILSNDIETCKKHKWNTYYFEIKWIDNPDELYSLYLMSLCMGGAIFSASTYSLWGVILGADQNESATIIYPSIWLHNTSSESLNLPKWWKTIESK